MRTQLFRAGLGVSVALLLGSVAPVPASAQVFGSKGIDAPTTIWQQPGPAADLVEGLGTWVYVAPESPAGAAQLSPAAYRYALGFSFPGLHLGDVELTSGPQGHVARLAITTVPYAGVEVPYDWVPGRFYFLYVHHLQAGAWGGWVMDWAAGTWTYVGTVEVPADWGLLTKSSRTMLLWPGAAGRAADCTGYPRSDGYFYPPLGFAGGSYTVATFDFHYVTPGDCPSQTDISDNGWVHYRLGADPA